MRGEGVNPKGRGTWGGVVYQMSSLRRDVASPCDYISHPRTYIISFLLSSFQGQANHVNHHGVM